MLQTARLRLRLNNQSKKTARLVESYFRDFPMSMPSGILPVVDSEIIYAEPLATANIWSRALQTEMELQNQCSQI